MDLSFRLIKPTTNLIVVIGAEHVSLGGPCAHSDDAGGVHSVAHIYTTDCLNITLVYHINFIQLQV